MSAELCQGLVLLTDWKQLLLGTVLRFTLLQAVLSMKEVFGFFIAYRMENREGNWNESNLGLPDSTVEMGVLYCQAPLLCQHTPGQWRWLTWKKSEAQSTFQQCVYVTFDMAVEVTSSHYQCQGDTLVDEQKKSMAEFKRTIVFAQIPEHCPEASTWWCHFWFILECWLGLPHTPSKPPPPFLTGCQEGSGNPNPT